MQIMKFGKEFKRFFARVHGGQSHKKWYWAVVRWDTQRIRSRNIRENGNLVFLQMVTFFHQRVFIVESQNGHGLRQVFYWQRRFSVLKSNRLQKRDRAACPPRTLSVFHCRLTWLMSA